MLMFRAKNTCVSYHQTNPNRLAPTLNFFFNFSIAKIHFTFFRQNMLDFFRNPLPYSLSLQIIWLILDSIPLNKKGRQCLFMVGQKRRIVVSVWTSTQFALLLFQNICEVVPVRLLKQAYSKMLVSF